MSQYFYTDTIEQFLGRSEVEVLGHLNSAAPMTVEYTQQYAWKEQIRILQDQLQKIGSSGHIFFEYSIPRLGRRVDVLLLVRHVLFVLEFKVGESRTLNADLDQVWDYALDLKNFHEASHAVAIAPILLPTESDPAEIRFETSASNDGVMKPLTIAWHQLSVAVDRALYQQPGQSVDVDGWLRGRYLPTPTIIEAATVLYQGHAVGEISRSGAEARNLEVTSAAVLDVIRQARANSRKAICFVTGVPGAGKTLVGLDISTRKSHEGTASKAVYLSGNGPLVNVLREALARDQVKRSAEQGQRLTLTNARRPVVSFIQNVHHFRDHYLSDLLAPAENVAIFDEAQRAWNQEETARFMKAKRGKPNFQMSEPEFLMSCLDRHKDWAVVVCLIGGGQEINKGEAGIREWLNVAYKKFPQWTIHVSPELKDTEYQASEILEAFKQSSRVKTQEALHLAVSMRSFKAQNVSILVKCILDAEIEDARQHVQSLRGKYPVVLTRSLDKAKKWIRTQARGSERYGIVVSSQAQRLKPLAVDVRVAVDPVNWFLKGKDDVRSSYYLEDVATEFDVQGLELDWSCVIWDGDFRRMPTGWTHNSFRGNRWEKISKLERQEYLRNAYRVLLTRARQGMVIVVPEGDIEDRTRNPLMYDGTYKYLAGMGFDRI